MLGYTRFGSAATAISGIWLMRRVRKRNSIRPLGLEDTAAPAAWNAVLFNREGILTCQN
ncbi:hypothetical protein FHX59_004795 [Paraburkholderia silvatlantica]|uniref:Uncharacterized protein n=1 Tax=Paraburkholderia silvatlantica TaxID=321895 RepID=A0A2U1ABN3_9BURK|nr:hypothetical protein [Paraburkholderia silvatlantica]PVY32163.1 hypothetical protein C7411_110126 [Paraburkholderia silvatlantica]PXW37783.1 hypothetical protein C7413_110126 [Paraburkholderia silvatlantica]PYE25604.1 hypothetical protein C7410_104184 [Paraburkholderia silvatlantica]TDQ97753.1 hypothetical protein C7412_10781 [Paraburkholderia silvatlantica]